VTGFHPRDFRHPENLDRAADWIRAEFERAGAVVGFQSWETDGATYRNVTAHFGPETPERIVVGAHYDTCDPLPGADDNASGVAGMLELSRWLGRSPPPLQVELVAYSLEEPPYFRTAEMGSAVHARALARAGARVRAMFALEMIGYFSDAPDSQRHVSAALAKLFPDQGNFIVLVGNLDSVALVRQVKAAMRAASTLPVESLNAPASLAGVDYSDHLNYWANGFPALMVTDTAFLRNPNYHEATDLPETLDYAHMAQVVVGVHEAIWSLARAD